MPETIESAISATIPRPSRSGRMPANVTNLRSRALFVVAVAISQLPRKWVIGDMKRFDYSTYKPFHAGEHHFIREVASESMLERFVTTNFAL